MSSTPKTPIERQMELHTQIFTLLKEVSPNFEKGYIIKDQITREGRNSVGFQFNKLDDVARIDVSPQATKLKFLNIPAYAIRWKQDEVNRNKVVFSLEYGLPETILRGAVASLKEEKDRKIAAELEKSKQVKVDPNVESIKLAKLLEQLKQQEPPPNTADKLSKPKAGPDFNAEKQYQATKHRHKTPSSKQVTPTPAEQVKSPVVGTPILTAAATAMQKAREDAAKRARLAPKTLPPVSKTPKNPSKGKPTVYKRP